MGSAEKADQSKAGHVATSFTGVITAVVEVGDVVIAGDPVATIEAMKMEVTITAPVSGMIERIVVSWTRDAENGDLVMAIV